MGYCIGIIRLRELQKQRHNIEWQLTLITQAKGVAANSVNDLMQVGTDYDDNSVMGKRLQQRKYQLKVYEEELDARKAALEQRLKAIETEIQSCQQMIQANIQSSFSYSVGGR
ncbi:MAG: hypothetical protein E7Z87_03335 [Cyanobacteria bacterium SIG26]|nr:hypothetical protein [Cyanobacteria bacterium SIG26]